MTGETASVKLPGIFCYSALHVLSINILNSAVGIKTGKEGQLCLGQSPRLQRGGC